MKKKILIILTMVIVIRLLIILLIKTDSEFFLSPRNFNRRGLVAMPSWIDFLLSILVILILYLHSKILFKLDP